MKQRYSVARCCCIDPNCPACLLSIGPSQWSVTPSGITAVYSNPAGPLRITDADLDDVVAACNSARLFNYTGDLGGLQGCAWTAAQEEVTGASGDVYTIDMELRVGFAAGEPAGTWAMLLEMSIGNDAMNTRLIRPSTAYWKKSQSDTLQFDCMANNVLNYDSQTLNAGMPFNGYADASTEASVTMVPV